jgi:hypothetical protein
MEFNKNVEWACILFLESMFLPVMQAITINLICRHALHVHTSVRCWTPLIQDCIPFR